jgi:hypothetical protein
LDSADIAAKVIAALCGCGTFYWLLAAGFSLLVSSYWFLAAF